MEGGTYARAIEAGFTEDQATFFMHLGCDTKNEAIEMMLREQKKIKHSKKLHVRFANELRSLANAIDKG